MSENYRAVFIVSLFVVFGNAQSISQPGTCGFTPDSTFFGANLPNDSVGYDGGGLMCDTWDMPCLPLTQNIPISRVVGWGTGSKAINGDGSLVNPDEYVANHVVSQYAWLSIPIMVGLWGSTDLVVSFNGFPLPNGTRHLDRNSPQFVSWCVPVPIKYLRFGTRTAGANSVPTPGLNQVTLTS